MALVTDRVDIENVVALASDLQEASARNSRWRREECINLIPSEQPVSSYVESLSALDPAARYNEHSHLKAEGPEIRYYKGTSFIMEKEIELKAALRTFFDCAQAEVRIISGQMANDTVYDALRQFRNRDRRGKEPRLLGPILVHSLIMGGHLSAQPMGALKNYVAVDPETGRPRVLHFPARDDNAHRIDVERTKQLILDARPELVIFGRSVIVHKEPVKEIVDFIHGEFGKDNPDRPLIMYDAAHVLGLLGDAFQDPLKEGADVVTGSTHKTFFGPQRGVILGNMAPGSVFEDLWRRIETRTFPGHVSNHHLGTMLGLLGATYEMIKFKDDYPGRVVQNAKAFAQALHDQGLGVEGDPGCMCTETHQVVLRVGAARGDRAATLLELNNIITNPQALFDDRGFAAASGVRLGVQEMTRYGMTEADFPRLAGLIADIIAHGDNRPAGFLRDEVKRMRADFTVMRYCF
jgi:aminomethyltransferase